MLRELNENEMMMVSGGVNTGIEILHVDSNSMGTALVDQGFGSHGTGVGFFDNPTNSLWMAMGGILGTLGTSDDGSNDCTPNGAQEAGFEGYADMEAWLNGYGHTRSSDGSAGALLAGILQDINNPGCTDD